VVVSISIKMLWRYNEKRVVFWCTKKTTVKRLWRTKFGWVT